MVSFVDVILLAPVRRGLLAYHPRIVAHSRKCTRLQIPYYGGLHVDIRLV